MCIYQCWLNYPKEERGRTGVYLPVYAKLAISEKAQVKSCLND